MASKRKPKTTVRKKSGARKRSLTDLSLTDRNVKQVKGGATRKLFEKIIW